MSIKCSNCPFRKLDAFKKPSVEQIIFMEKFKTGELDAEPGTNILAEGQSSSHLFTCLDGMGLRHKTAPGGKRQVIGFVLPGDFIGLQAGVMSQMSHSVEATTAMRLCAFNRSDLWTLVSSQPTLALDIVQIAAREEAMLSEALAVVGQMGAAEKIAWALHRFHKRLSGTGTWQGNSVPLPFLQRDLADALGLSLVHTNKTLARLRNAQIASWTEGRLTIHDMGRLKDMIPVETADFVDRPLV